MTFEGQYLTYLEYQTLTESLGGSPIEEMPFNLLEFEARRKIDIRTFNRIKTDDIPQAVKLCEYEMINSINEYVNSINEASSNGSVKSESTDGYSISYLSANEISSIVKSKNDELEDIIRTYLLGIIYNNEHLLYCGVD